jgi:hypothetical protein
MVTSKALRPEWLPAVVLSAALASLMLLWDPRVGDLAAQVFHTELFQHGGLAIWNSSWYGGHYTLNYSLLFPPAAALLGPQVVGLLSVVASSYLFDRLVHDRWGTEARWATLWFAAGVVTLLADGQLTFALGAGVWDRGARLNRAALAAAALAFVLTVAPNLAFPEPGRFPFVFSSFVAIPVWCAGALFLTWRCEGEARLRRVVAGYALASLAIFLTPNALGGNAVRLGAVFGGPVLAAVLLTHRDLPRPRPWVPRWFYLAVLAVTLTGSLYWQFTATAIQVARAVGDPSTSASYFHPASKWLNEHGGRGVRIEVPPTANHWESAYLAPKFELARGWLRQLDTARDDIFYKEGALNTRSYGRWLRANAIGFVALPEGAPLDYSSTEEAKLIATEPPYLRQRFHDEHWRIYEVVHPKPLVEPMGTGRASAVSVGHQGFALDVTNPGEFLVRVSFTPYWSIGHGSGCLLRRGDWTIARATHPGIFSVDADFSLDGAWNAVTGAKKTC